MLSAASARRLALAAQGFGGSRERLEDGPGALPALRRLLDRVMLLQIDSVNVFARAHTMPLYSRAGAYDTEVLGRAQQPGERRLLVESWAHEATLLRADLWPLLGFRRERAARDSWAWIRDGREAVGDAGLARILALVATEGPLTAPQVSRRLGDTAPATDGWGWRRTSTQWAVEHLFRSGHLDGTGRTTAFERRYLPAAATGLAAMPDVPEDRAVHHLVELSARALGVASPATIRDYFRLPAARAKPALAALTADGVLQDVLVRTPDGDVPMLRHAAATRGRTVPGTALVSPFDPLIFHRPRLSALFGVDYRIGIYTPAHRRTHGYYALPILHRDRIVARADLKADRRSGELVVQQLDLETAATAVGRVRAAHDDGTFYADLADELARAARWQGLVAVRCVRDRAPERRLTAALAEREPVGGH